MNINISIKKIIIILILFLAVLPISSNSMPPIDVPPAGGLVQCQEDLDMCTDDLDLCDNDLEDLEQMLSDCEEELFKRVFLTSTTYNAALGGVSGADAKCNLAAANAGLTGTFKAWIADDTTSPSTSFTRSTQPYALVDPSNTRIADNWTDLTTCDEGPGGDECLDNPINIDENGNIVEGGDGVLFSAWTNTNTDGSVFDTDPNLNCNNFTSDSSDFDRALGGGPDEVDDRWVLIASLSCNLEAHLYCFEQ